MVGDLFAILISALIWFRKCTSHPKSLTFAWSGAPFGILISALIWFPKCTSHPKCTTLE